MLYINNQTTNSKSLSALKDYFSFNKKQMKLNSYSEDDADLFYIRFSISLIKMNYN